MREWEEQRLARPREGRHHLAVGADVEDAFWRCFLAGGRLDVALRAAGVGRSTGYRWWRARFLARREQGLTVRAAARELRVPPARARRWEDERRKAAERASRERDAAERLSSLRHALMAFREATDKFRDLDAPIYSDLENPGSGSLRRRREEAEDQVLDHAKGLIIAAQGCGPNGQKVVLAAFKLMQELGIDAHGLSLPAIELEAVQVELENIKPSQAMQFVVNQ
jgi:hypothetical protein